MTIMTDTERIQELERQLADVKSELARLTRAVQKTRESTQTAVNDLQRSIGVIFGNTKVPNVTWDPRVKHIIE